MSEKTWQGSQESNPEPMVLETITLPIELLPCVNAALLGFFVDHMAAYIRIELPQFQPLRIITAVFLGVVDVTAFRATHLY